MAKTPAAGPEAVTGDVRVGEAGFELEAIGQAIAEGIVAYLPGRTERVSGDTGPSVYVDFGHSPDAFLNTLSAVRKVTPGRVIMVFGADGDRDATKRHEMGRVASEGSDILIVTDHHPRFEDPVSIRTTLIEGAALAEHQAQLKTTLKITAAQEPAWNAFIARAYFAR